jgi:hypothetical protein
MVRPPLLHWCVLFSQSDSLNLLLILTLRPGSRLCVFYVFMFCDARRFDIAPSGRHDVETTICSGIL